MGVSWTSRFPERVKSISMVGDYLASFHALMILLGMPQQYLLHPEPPLVSDPGVICILSKAALSRNLEAHAAINPSITFTGPRDEMEERLRKILEVRKLDLAVREMLARHDG